MRNILKATTLENKLPLLAVENNFIVSKDADLTACYKIVLPEIFTISGKDYEMIHASWLKAIRVLPDYTVVHKQDFYVEEKYMPDFQKEMTFFERSNEKHFYERPYLRHFCYLFVTKTTKERMNQQSNFSSLCRGNIISSEVNSEAFNRFADTMLQFDQIINDSGYIRLTKLTDDEILGTNEQPGIIQKYLSLSSNSNCLDDIELLPDHVRVGNKIISFHTLSDTDDLPGFVSEDCRYEKYSTDQTECNISFAGHLGLLLNCNHCLNQYIFVDNTAEILQKFEKRARNMHSLSRYSRENQINKQWIDLYLNEAHSKGLTAVRCHVNILAWAEGEAEIKKINNEVGSNIAMTGCRPRHNTVDAASLFWAGIPGNCADFPHEESFYTFLDQAICFFANETNYRDSLSPLGIKFCDRNGKPLHVDISEQPMKEGLISNRNMFIVGGSGSGKSFLMNHITRQYWEQNTHILIIDVGNSYQGLCNLINKKTGGEDGIYFTYSEKQPISFNPFYTSDYVFDVEKKDSIKTLLLTLWKAEHETISKTESGEIGNMVAAYIQLIQNERNITPSFNTFYEYVRDIYRKELANREIKVDKKEFNIDNFLTTLKQYYKDGRFGFLLNSKANIDLLNKRFIIFEIDSIQDNKELFSVITLIIMETFINKMRHLAGQRKMIIIEEAWKSLMNKGMEQYIKYLCAPVKVAS